MPLLEIITHPGTAGWVTATSHAFGKQIGKTPIIVNDAPGFYANRILSPYMAEAALLLEEGVRMEEIDAAMTSWGYPVGPITLYDEVGLDVAQKAGTILAAAFADRMQPSGVLDRMVADGRQGRKNGRGFFTYGEDGKKGEPDETVYAVIGNPAAKTVARTEIQERLGLMMVNEALRTLEEGVLRSRATATWARCWGSASRPSAVARSGTWTRPARRPCWSGCAPWRRARPPLRPRGAAGGAGGSGERFFPDES
jgi:3-hydroxyacyl-CoA dehydrogenase/enoyl-CoA hydratase/3-hydroxybutyryl-CoA epimerase